MNKAEVFEKEVNVSKKKKHLIWYGKSVPWRRVT